MARHSFLPLLLASLTFVPTASAQESGKSTVVKAQDRGVADTVIYSLFLYIEVD